MHVYGFLIKQRFVYRLPHTHIVDDTVRHTVVVDIAMHVFVQQQSLIEFVFVYLTLSFSKTGNVLFEKEKQQQCTASAQRNVLEIQWTINSGQQLTATQNNEIAFK